MDRAKSATLLYRQMVDLNFAHPITHVPQVPNETCRTLLKLMLFCTQKPVWPINITSFQLSLLKAYYSTIFHPFCHTLPSERIVCCQSSKHSSKCSWNDSLPNARFSLYFSNTHSNSYLSQQIAWILDGIKRIRNIWKRSPRAKIFAMNRRAFSHLTIVGIAHTITSSKNF